MNWKLITTNKNPPLLRELKVRGFKEGYKELYNFNYDNYLYIREEIYVDIDTHRRFIEHIKKYRNLISNTLDKEEIECKHFIDLCRSISNLDYKTLSDVKILGLLKKFFTYYKKITKYLLLHVALDTIVQERLKEIFKDEFDKYIPIVTLNTIETNNYRFTKRLLELAAGMNNDVGELLKSYSWLNLEDGVGTPLTKEDILRRVSDIVDPKERLEKMKTEISENMELIEKIKQKFGIEDLVDQTQRLIFKRAQIDDDLNIGGLMLIDFFNDIARRIGITYEDLFYLSTNEIEKAFNGELIDISDRKKASGVLLENGQVKILSAKDIDKFSIKTMDIVRDLVQGKCACPGIARGYAKIVKGLNDMEKVEIGDIMIMRASTPAYVSAIERSQAVITDVGGVTSHAAILSRELGKPCIIGTEVATSIFKDGDLVELDAEKGIANKIKSPALSKK